jgi:hypothetical protein
MKYKALLMALLVFILIPNVLFAEIYRCVDGNGSVTFSAEPDPGCTLLEKSVDSEESTVSEKPAQENYFFSTYGVNNFQEFTVLLIVSIIFTWLIGLSVPIIIRVLAKKPIPKLWAIIICGVWWFILISTSILLGSQANTTVLLCS